ncbi:hypothetical protein SARC_00227 [Sphaeroforma arctica JP610]|uniref:Uncharacterized protein n=1 Tax=Sphaeroforma arctica JP610 TaxID=667725 RepID=A0A0L0GFP4_9EUKA|nr:hypothetical protein SARC_00227 [Sphaeroforma arctica JP610]KNC87656.1 hypothetical protein SARC_00227 [Sphaeroforma arctica JP610]|eukprot:XP_014161558.1 hypothetical protein SARC_00227 [Sphaeroforma arctica JP610]
MSWSSEVDFQCASHMSVAMGSFGIELGDPTDTSVESSGKPPLQEYNTKSGDMLKGRLHLDLRRAISFDSISCWIRCCCEFGSQETELILAGGTVENTEQKYPAGKHTIEFSQLVPTGPPTLRIGTGKDELHIVWTVVITAKKEADAPGELVEKTDVLIATMCFDNGVSWPIPRNNLIDGESIAELKGKQLSLSLATDRVFEFDIENPLKSMKVQVKITNETGKNIESVKLKFTQLAHVHLGMDEEWQGNSGTNSPTPNESKPLSAGQMQLAHHLNRKSSTTKKIMGGIKGLTNTLHITSPHTISGSHGKKYKSDFQLTERILNSTAEQIECTTVVLSQPSDFKNHNLAVSRVAYAQKKYQIRNPANSAYESPITSPPVSPRISPRHSLNQSPSKFPPAKSTPPRSPNTSRKASFSASPRALSPATSPRASHASHTSSPARSSQGERSVTIHLDTAVPDREVAIGAEVSDERRETVTSRSSMGDSQSAPPTMNNQAVSDFSQMYISDGRTQQQSGSDPGDRGASPGVRPIPGVSLYVPGNTPLPQVPKAIIFEPVDDEAELQKEKEVTERARKPHICPSFTYNSTSAQISVAYVVEGRIQVAGTTVRVKVPLDLSCAWL